MREKILVTGASGFVGKYFVDFLCQKYAVTTLGNRGEEINCDLSKEVPALPEQYDTVIHLAGKAHTVPKTEAEANAFFEVNVTGLKNLLTALEMPGRLPKKIVLFSTVAVYGRESGEGINEETPLKASDPYGKSKIQAEHMLHEWVDKNSVILTILRPPLIVGKNAPGNLGDMVNAIRKKRYFQIGGGKTRRSMVLADDIPPFVEKIWDKGGCYHITDGHHPSFKELSETIAKLLNKLPIINLPYWFLKPVALFFDFLELITRKKMPLSGYKLKKLTNSYTFDDAHARQNGWESRKVIDSANLWIN